ncbi:hypothetical protein [Actinokineospora enzanensis]|uniref:hypothetical protein n=1 Tax=Actinokineospora enzanensis TaxID=155975 RepID=UPI00037AE87B|nr:hypothetical protein [Actinokineospora enzanensis]
MPWFDLDAGLPFVAQVENAFNWADRTVHVRFEDGWSGTKEIRLNHEDKQVTVVMELAGVG